MAPPGIPNITSTPDASRLFTNAVAPFIALPFAVGTCAVVIVFLLPFLVLQFF